MFVAACESPLIILKAPAGFGKTVAALYGYYAYADRHRGTALAWLSLDAEDDRPGAFIAYLIAAVNHAVELSEVLLNQSETPAGNNMRALVGQLLFELDQVESELMIVLDDFHLIEDEHIHASLGYFVKHLPPHIKLVLTTRSEPPANIMSLRLQGLVAELDSQQLAFNLLETKAFFQEFANTDVPDEQANQLLDQIEGWAVGLQLIVLGMRNNPSLAALGENLSQKNLNIIDYFDSELFDGLPAEVKTFLLNTSVVKRFNLDVADALCPGINVHEILEYLKRHHLFVVQFNEPRDWYRYHHLMYEFLQHKLLVAHSDSLPELHLQASDVFLRLGYVVGAVDHAIRSGEREQIIRILKKHGNELIHKAHYDLVRRCLAELSEEEILEDANLVLVRCWVEAIFGDATLVHDFLGRARQLVEAAPVDQRDFLRAEMLTVNSQAAFTLQFFERASAYAREALTLYEADSIRRQSALLILANVLFEQGDIIGALEIYEESELLSRQESNYDAVLWSLNQQAVIWKSRGDFVRSAELSREVIDYAGEQGVRYGFNVVFAYINQAEIALEEYHLREAKQLIHRIQNLCETWDDYWQLHLQGWLLKCEMLKGKPTVARELATEHELILSQEYTADVLMPYSTEVQLQWWWQNGDLKKIKTWLKAKPEVSEYRSIRDFMLLRAEAYGLAATEDFGAARRKLKHAIQHAETKGFRVEVIRMALLKAAVTDIAGDHEQATRQVRRLLPSAASLGLVASWLFLRQWLMPILERLMRSEVFPPEVAKYADQLLTLNRQRNTADRPGGEQIPDALLAAGVSRKEWRVYKHILAGMSNEEIAGTMFIAVSTVKTHINNLYKKLGVRTRREAIERGESLIAE
ncbi:MAG: LuxR C-terminal-related transcriptional regulator [Natronospirillum sp.]|uniref:LuxR C-terminal-related transcriptional regulator n=1 Tax=Natronospirillum sp. TaxID=2812955 RepID=UPI0025D3872F|nr:LuxR C-terminal-related transcriptional regulator [Natronospirillum sp.]MCH8553021.1 LuxR C-terminal-related transcriptional regulator [Natronospirillum sp.]